MRWLVWIIIMDRKFERFFLKLFISIKIESLKILTLYVGLCLCKVPWKTLLRSEKAYCNRQKNHFYGKCLFFHCTSHGEMILNYAVNSSAKAWLFLCLVDCIFWILLREKAEAFFVICTSGGNFIVVEYSWLLMMNGQNCSYGVTF